MNKKFITLLVIAAFFASLIGVMPVKNVSAATGLKAVSTDTLLPTYVMGELITGTTQTAVRYVYLVGADPAVVATYGAVYYKYMINNPIPAIGDSFVLATTYSVAPIFMYEGTYAIVESNVDVALGAIGAAPAPLDTRVYLKYVTNIATNPATLTIGATNVLFAGLVSTGASSQMVPNTTIATLVGPTGFTPISVNTLNGQFNFIVPTISIYGTYTLYITDGYLPDNGSPVAAAYKTWTVAPGSLIVTPVINPTLLYADATSQSVNIYVTDANKVPVSGALTIAYQSGVNPTVVLSPVTQSVAGYYSFSMQLAPTLVAGSMTFKLSMPSAEGSLTLTLNALGDWNPRLGLLMSDGLNFGSTLTFIPNTTTVSTLTEKYFVNGATGPLSGTEPTYSIQSAGDLSYSMKALLWEAGKDALTTTTFEKEQKFTFFPKVAGDIVTFDTTSAQVGETKNVSATVKIDANTERNNGVVVLRANVDGMFPLTAPAPYTTDTVNGRWIKMDAASVNINIVGGKYTFAGLKFLKTGAITVETYNQLGDGSFANLTSRFVDYITVTPPTVTMVSSVPTMVTGMTYPSVKVTGAVKDLVTWTGLAPILDNGDGSYMFQFTTPVTADITLYAVNTDGSKAYTVIIPVVKPTLKITSAHADGKITSMWAEKIEFKLVDPITNADIAYTEGSAAIDYTKWLDNSSYPNLAVSSLYNYATNAYEVTSALATKVNATVGNPSVDPQVNPPTLAITARINGILVSYPNVLTVSDPSISFSVAGQGDNMKMFNQVPNQISATVVDAHKIGLKNALVAIVGNSSANWYTEKLQYVDASFGGIANDSGSVSFSFTPTYVGNYKLMVASPESFTGDALVVKFVESMPAPVDTQAPVITINENVDGTTVASKTLRVTGSVSEKVSALYANDKPVTVLPDRSFVVMLDLLDGANTVLFTTFDMANNKGTKSFTVTYKDNSIKPIVLKMTLGTDIVSVNGNATSTDAGAELINGRTFVPARFIVETFGAEVAWLSDTHTINIKMGTNTIGIQIGNTMGVVGLDAVTLPAAPYIKNGRTMVPLRFLELVGALVEWDPATKVVTVTYTPPIAG